MNEDVIIVGSSVHALLMSYHKRIPIVLTKFNPPSPDQMFKRAIVIEGIPFKRYNECWEFLKFVISKVGPRSGYWNHPGQMKGVGVTKSVF